jgi:hypothetical protein
MTIGPDTDSRRLQVAPVRRSSELMMTGNDVLLGGPLIDTAEMQQSFLIGSDVPPDTAT